MDRPSGASLGSPLLVPLPALLLSHPQAPQPQMLSPGEKVTPLWVSSPSPPPGPAAPGGAWGWDGHPQSAFGPSSLQGQVVGAEGVPGPQPPRRAAGSSTNKTQMDQRRVCEVSYL